MTKIGITERGDAHFSDKWIEPVRLGLVGGVVVISKELPTPAGQKFMRENPSKVIFHATTTGYGGTVLEPNVEKAFPRLDRLAAFCNDGFPMERVVIRIDPIIPTDKGVSRAFGVAYHAAELGFRRFRWSWIDLYGHVVQRFASVGIDAKSVIAQSRSCMALNHTSPEAEWRTCRRRIADMFPFSVFESCAEKEECVGCISQKDFVLFGLDPTEAQGRAGQRDACMCCANKTELLDERRRCPFRCLYCYWKD